MQRRVATTIVQVAGLCLGLAVAPPARAAVYQYLDDDGNVHFTQDPGSVPPAFRDRTIEASPEDLKHIRPSAMERLRDVLDVQARELPPEIGPGGSFASDGLPAGSAGSAGEVAGGEAPGGVPGAAAGTPGGGRAGLPPDVDLGALRDQIENYARNSLMRKLVIAQVAAMESGFLWVVLLALVLAGFILGTRRLISLEDSRYKRWFWKWGFPLLALVVVYLLARRTYPTYVELYTVLARALGV